MKMTRILGAAVVLIATSFVLASGAKAQSTNAIPNLVYYVTLSDLNALPTTAGENSLDFQLITGSGNVTNTVTLSNFVFTGGSADSSGGIYTTNNVTGSLGSSIVLSSLIGQGGQVNEFDESFTTNVTSISFKVTVTPNDEVAAGAVTPDQFNIAIQDGNGTNIPTTDLFGGSTLANESIASTNNVASINTFSGTGPDTGVTVSAVPEPSTYALIGLGALMLVMVARRRNA